MRLEFEITESEYLEGAAAQQRTAGNEYRPVTWAGILGAAAGFALLFASDWEHVLAPILLIALGLFLPIYPWLSHRRRLERGWQTYATTGPAIWDFSEEAVKCRTSISSTTYSWNAFERVVETRSLFLLYLKTGRPLLIPKRAFPDSQVCADFRSLLETVLSRPKPGFPVQLHER